MWKDEWDFWTSEPSPAELKVAEHIKEVLIKVAHSNLPPTKDQLDLLDHETEIVPGIQAVFAPGHIPGHIAVAVTSDGEKLLALSDTVILPIHIDQPNWYAAVDFSPEQAVASRRRLLNWPRPRGL